MPTNIEFLRPVLGEELFNQVSEKLETSGLNLVNLNDGSHIPKAKFDEEHNKLKTLNATIADLNAKLAQAQAQSADATELNAQIARLTADLSARDAQISSLGLTYRVKDALRGMNARNVDVIMPLLKMDTISEKDGKIVGLQEQVDEIKKSDAYLFNAPSGAKGGFGGGQTIDQNFDVNAAMNNAIRGAHS